MNQEHWIVAQLNLAQFAIVLYDSSVNGHSDESIMKFIEPLCVAMPLYLQRCRFYSLRGIERPNLFPWPVTRI